MRTLKAKMILPQDIMDLQKIFTTNGYSLFVVGGAVRDYVLGVNPHDFDLVTNATPDQVIDILSNYNTDLQGAQFGVVRVFTEDEPEGHEIASYRKDLVSGRDNKSEGDKVEIGNHITIEDDVQRRDITINAMFYDIEKQEIIDLVGGIDDIENEIIRAVGNASMRFIEDRLRILRVARFSATYNFEIDSDTELSIRQDNRLFDISEEDDVSKERIVGEFLKVEEKSKNDPMIMTRYFRLLGDFGILNQVFPNMIISHNIKPTTNLAVALGQILRGNEVNSKLGKDLNFAKIPNKIQDTIINILDIDQEGINENNFFKFNKILSRNRDTNFDALVEWNSVMGVDNQMMDAFLEFEPSVSGHDVINDGFNGVEIGREIERRERIIFLNLIG